MKRNLQEKGYSKAIDIWSIGCITATLLTNDMIFPHQANEYAVCQDETMSESSSGRWDLSIMDRGEAWIKVGRKARSFVRGCLLLDEGQRLTATDALLHPWFTNKHYAADIEAAYQRAIQDWTPRRKGGHLIEFIDTTDAMPATSELRPIHEETRSHHFQTAPPVAPMASSLFKAPAGMSQQKRVRTPLPAINEEVDRGVVQVSASPRSMQHENLCAETRLKSDGSTQLLAQESQDAIPQLSAESLEAPCFQSHIESPLLEMQGDANDSLTQSQVMLDELSPRNDLHDDADGAVYPRKKVCR